MIIFGEQCWWKKFWWEKFNEEKPNLIYLTLFAPAYLSISSNRGGAHCAPPLYLGVGWSFGNYLAGSDLLYSKGFMKFRCPEPSKKMFYF